MFGSIQKEQKNPVQGLVVTTIILLGVGLFVFLHAYVQEKTWDSLQSEDIHLINISAVTPSSEILSKRVKRLPQAIIIGARKSGTRALLKFLEVNPSVRAAHSEVHFFDKPQNYKLGYDWYKQQMPESIANELTIEKSPAYFVTRGVPEKVKAMNSSIKLVLILRNPVTRLISDYSQLIANKIEATEEEQEEEDRDYGDENYSESSLSSNLTLAAWEKAAKDFENYVLRPDGGIDDQRRAVKIGMYSIYLEKWRSLFPREQFHIVNGETLVSNPHRVLRELELFLGLKPTIQPNDFVFNARKGFYCLATNNTRTSKEGVEFISTIKSINQGQEKTNGTLSSCLSRSKGRRHVYVKQDLIERLNRFYAPYNEYLYTLMGENFNLPK